VSLVGFKDGWVVDFLGGTFGVVLVLPFWGSFGLGLGVGVWGTGGVVSFGF